ncbi:GIY-YIG nuclease family protein [Clostridium punense]|nr:GIY-YIG nuclease family protein [Clostridium punense]
MMLKEKVKNLPNCPGVYLMKDSLDNIIYVGKSKNLKNRVRSYFYSSKHSSSKIEKLVQNLKDFDYIVTDTEFEAFMLECQLIKKLKPTYNRLMKSPLAYTYIKITMDESYPNIEVTNSYEENTRNLYYGPYAAKGIVENAIEGLKKFYKINCSNPTKKNSTCLNYSLGLCLGMCIGGSAQNEYISIINKIIGILSGLDNTLLLELEEAMNNASEEFNFETAAKYRDCIEALKSLINKEKILDFTKANNNILMLESLKENQIKSFLIKGNRVIFSKQYTFNNPTKELIQEIKDDILANFTTDVLNSSIKVTRDDIDEAQIIYSYLKTNNCKHIIIPDEYLKFINNTKIDEAINSLLSN